MAQLNLEIDTKTKRDYKAWCAVRNLKLKEVGGAAIAYFMQQDAETRERAIMAHSAQLGGKIPLTGDAGARAPKQSGAETSAPNHVEPD